MSIDYHVELIKFPSGKVHEAVTQNEDGSVTIFLDKNATHEVQSKCFQHALRHIEENDFGKISVQNIEATAHSS